MRTAARFETRRAEMRRRPNKSAQMFVASLRRTATILEGRIQVEEHLHLLRDPSRVSTSLPARSMRRRLKALQGMIQKVEAA